jgi:glycosyltransferase involved in cell wall biosynthesis
MSELSPGDVQVVILAPLYRPAHAPAAAAGTRAWGLATGLRNTGFRVTVIYALRPGYEAAPEDGIEMLAPRWPSLETVAARTGFATERNVRSHVNSSPSSRGRGRRLISSLVPDRYASWIPSAAAAAREAAGERSILFSTGPPSSRFAARFAHRRRPWIADINDLWAMNPGERGHPVLDRIDTAIERATIGYANRLTTVNDVMTEELRRRFDIPVATILSGFDPGDFVGRRHNATSGPVRLLLAGTIYPKLDMHPLWTAMRQGKQEGWLTPERLQVTFVGRLSERAALEAADFGIAELVRTKSPVPRDELLDELVAADVLLLPLSWPDPTALPMRFFEYVGSGRPIIAFGSPYRIAGRYVHEHGLGVVAPGSAELADVLRRLTEQRDAVPAPDPAVRRRFTWEQSVERLSELVLETAREDAGRGRRSD